MRRILFLTIAIACAGIACTKKDPGPPRISNYRQNPHPATPADASISRGFIANEEKITDCYSKSKRAHSDLAGKLVDIEVIFTVSQEGKVSGFEIYRSNSPYPEIPSCIQSTIEAIQFTPVTLGMPKLVTETFYFGP